MTDFAADPLLLALGLASFLLCSLYVLAQHRLKQAKKQIADLLRRLTDVETRFEPILSIELELEGLAQQKSHLLEDIQAIRDNYREKRDTLDRLEAQIAVFDERLSFAELGVYEPHFDFKDSETFKRRIREVRDEQKAMISAKVATICPANWTVDGSLSKGKTMVNRQTRLTMRAFNNECEAAIANARWNNVVAMEKRIVNAAKQINSANVSMQLELSEEYVQLKLTELYLTHEYREQIKAEKDERAEKARAERSEKKLIAEARAAEKEENKYAELLSKARREAGVDEARIAELERELFLAQEKSARARSMAEMTKSGYVYVISNVGSFGPDIVKIGLTRRLDPDDRVKELGDASVPFGFDVHAMIYSEEAPALEAALHREFDGARVNIANTRKEFFRVSLEDVELAVRKLAPEANFFSDREAQEWHETLARRSELLAARQGGVEEFPREL